MSEEEIIEIFNNLKEYIQDKINSGEHKIYYNDLCWDIKCVDCITAIDTLLELYKEQKEEIEQLANGIRVLGTNPDITTEEIIKEFTEKPITEEYMKKLKGE